MLSVVHCETRLVLLSGLGSGAPILFVVILVKGLEVKGRILIGR